MSGTPRHAGNLVESLGSALRDGRHGLATGPGLLKRVLEEQSWRDFETQRGDRVAYERIEEFVTTQPLKGLGTTIELVERVIGTDDPDLLRLWRAARKGRPGRKPRAEKRGDSPRIHGGQDTDQAADRLARDAPDQYEAVKRGEKTINAAARDAGIRPHRISVRLDRPQSIAASLRRHMTPEQLSTLARLLLEG